MPRWARDCNAGGGTKDRNQLVGKSGIWRELGGGENCGVTRVPGSCNELSLQQSCPAGSLHPAVIASLTLVATASGVVGLPLHPLTSMFCLLQGTVWCSVIWHRALGVRLGPCSALTRCPCGHELPLRALLTASPCGHELQWFGGECPYRVTAEVTGWADATVEGEHQCGVRSGGL